MAYTEGQAKCINTLDRSLVVAAGAGSGKTFTLTKRIVNALQTGAVDGIERVCAITFTNKAAGELKSRIKAELRACGLAEQALKVDEAWVSTIHGMCARILRAHAVELDLDPAFKMADAPLVNALRSRAVDDVLGLAQAADEACDGLPDRARLDALFAEYPPRSYGPRGSSVESMLLSLVEAAGSRPDGFDSFVVRRSSPNAAALVMEVVETFEALVDLAAVQKPNEARSAWVAATSQHIAVVRAGLEQGHAGDMSWALSALDGFQMPKRVGAADYKVQVANAIDLHKTCVMELRLALAGGHLDTLLMLARKAQHLFSQSKRAVGVLDNNDLLVCAFGAITKDAAIAAQYADKFQLVMVDEFQDTDQMQVDMIKLLAGPGACRLCTVGDAQQSIYRFRGADVSVYMRHLASVEATDADNVIRLSDNFRSHPDVLALVDRVFGRSQMFGGGFMSLKPGRSEERVKRPLAVGASRIQVQLTSNSFRGASSADVRLHAAARLADAFADLRDRGHSAGEMAVLLGGMTYADVYADALRARGLACVISGGSVFAGTPEALLVADLADVVANPFQTRALHNVLTSPLFELDAQDLLQLGTTAADDGSFRRANLGSGLVSGAYRLRAGEQDPAWSARLVLALRVMGEAIDAAGRSKVSRIMRRVVLDSGWATRLQRLGPEGLASAGNVYKAIRMIESIEASKAAGPSCVASDYRALLQESKEAPGALSATGGDFVRIMTVHASKGLEFPIVAVAEFKETAASVSRLLVGEVRGKTYLSLDLCNTLNKLDGSANVKDVQSLFAAFTEGCADETDLERAIVESGGALALRAALAEYGRMGDEEEAKRLLYVALTRAKEALVVSLKGKRTKDNPLATPKSCLGAVVEALAGDGEGFDVGTSHFDFEGGAPAFVEHWALETSEGLAPGNGQEGLGVAVGGDGGQPESEGACVDADAVRAQGFFDVPVALPRTGVHRMPYAPAHEGVFSYSSIAEASHKTEVLGRLVDLGFVSADAGAEQTTFSLFLRPSGEVVDDAAMAGWYDAGRNAAVVDEDDGSWAYVGTSVADSDKATDLGTAFHRLAQHAVATRAGAEPLARPDAKRIDALCATCDLDDVQRERLQEALDRWFASDVAARVASYGDVRAEVPFFLRLPAPLMPDAAYLEGEIDLLALADDGTHALVVDYKTGGRADETADELAAKHVLQAACYAYAVMQQGITQLEAVFVRVERPREGALDQPQCVRYAFSSADLDELARAIVDVRACDLGIVAS